DTGVHPRLERRLHSLPRASEKSSDTSVALGFDDTERFHPGVLAQEHRCDCAARTVNAHDLREVDVHDRIRIHRDESAAVEITACVTNSAAGVLQDVFLAVMYANAETRPVADVRADLLTEMM